MSSAYKQWIATGRMRGRVAVDVNEGVDDDAMLRSSERDRRASGDVV